MNRRLRAMGEPTLGRLCLGLAGGILALAAAGSVGAYPFLYNAWVTRYPDSTLPHAEGVEGFHCGICHITPLGGGPRNPYGIAFFNAGGLENQQAALEAIEFTDSDGDTINNFQEILHSLPPGFVTVPPPDTVAQFCAAGDPIPDVNFDGMFDAADVVESARRQAR